MANQKQNKGKDKGKKSTEGNLTYPEYNDRDKANKEQHQTFTNTMHREW